MTQTLAERLAQPDMAGLTDWQAAAVLTTPDPALTCRIDVATADVANYLARQQVVHKLRALVSSQTESVAELGESIVFVLDGRWEYIRCSDPTVDAAFQAQLAAIVSLGVITQAHADHLNAMANGCQSWAQANGVEVTARTVGLARGGI